MRLFIYLFVFLLGFSPIVLAGQSLDEPFVIVELFSSEGCSSCPPADLLVSKLTVWARQNNVAVYPIIFHVDYWNNLGWRDVFSRAEFTQRQYEYAKIFKDQGVYTPQIVMNGSDAFVGSDQGKLQQGIDRELAISPSINMNASLNMHNKELIVNYQVHGFSNGDVINFALVERGLITDVTAGENAGRTLHHDNVVREFQTLLLKKVSSQVRIPLDKVSDSSQASVIIYVQNPQTMLIEDAKQLDLAP